MHVEDASNTMNLRFRLLLSLSTVVILCFALRDVEAKRNLRFGQSTRFDPSPASAGVSSFLEEVEGGKVDNSRISDADIKDAQHELDEEVAAKLIERRKRQILERRQDREMHFAEQRRASYVRSKEVVQEEQKAKGNTIPQTSSKIVEDISFDGKSDDVSSSPSSSPKLSQPHYGNVPVVSEDRTQEREPKNEDSPRFASAGTKVSAKVGATPWWLDPAPWWMPAPPEWGEAPAQMKNTFYHPEMAMMGGHPYYSHPNSNPLQQYGMAAYQAPRITMASVLPMNGVMNTAIAM